MIDTRLVSRLANGARVAAALVASAWLAVAGAPAGAQPAGVPEQECDRLGQPPRQAMGVVPAFSEGVGFTTLRGEAARAACTKAMTEFPGEMRFVTYAARASDKAGDATEAIRLYRIAADAGNPIAQSNLGAMLEKGEGRQPKNPREAERLYRLSADQGYPGGQSNLATLYAFGRGVPRNDREAVRLWQLAVMHDEVQAQTNLGTMYAEGRGGLPRDTREAARLWRLAADQGSTEARNNLRKLGVR